MSEAEASDQEGQARGEVDGVEPTGAGLAVQNLAKVAEGSDGVFDITPETPEIVSRQATINIGTIGHVAHGKSTVVRAISGIRTTKFKDEAVRNITIHLGYANAKIFKSPGLEEPECYRSYGSSQPDNTECPKTKQPMKLVRHVSFVDCPGHDVLMATMLNGASIMDAALLLIAANEPFPQPQTLEHLKAVEIMKLTKLIVLQNKIDLVREADATEQRRQISNYFESTVGLHSPILPISAQLQFNIDIVLQYIVHIPTPTRQLRCPALMVVVRSFDVNCPGDIDNLKGGVAGGSVLRGIVKIDQSVEVRPGIVERLGEGRFRCRAIYTKIRSLYAETNPLQFAIPGGLIAAGTTLDPSLTRQNKLVGQLLGSAASLPDVYTEIDVEHALLSQLVGTKKKSTSGGVTKVTALTDGETLQINIGTLTVAATVIRAAKINGLNLVRLALDSPACCTIGEMVTISRRHDSNFRLIGWGTIRRGITVPLDPGVEGKSTAA